MLEEYTQRRNYIVDRLQKIGLFCFKPEGAFYVFPNVSKYFGKKFGDKVIRDSRDFSKILLEEAMVAIVFGAAYGANDYVRLTYAPSSIEEIKRGMDRIEEFLFRLQK
jgi:aspartate aminotransferase